MADFTLRPLTLPERKYTYALKLPASGTDRKHRTSSGGTSALVGPNFIPLGLMHDLNGKPTSSSGTWTM